MECNTGENLWDIGLGNEVLWYIIGINYTFLSRKLGCMKIKIFRSSEKKRNIIKIINKLFTFLERIFETVISEKDFYWKNIKKYLHFKNKSPTMQIFKNWRRIKPTFSKIVYTSGQGI